MTGEMRSILISGVPRSGTTWVGEILSSARGAELIIEPDNEKTSILARAYKVHEHRFPSISINESHPCFEELWEIAFFCPVASFLSRSWLTRMLYGPRSARERYVLAKTNVLSDKKDFSRGKISRKFVKKVVSHVKKWQIKKTRVVKSGLNVLCIEWVVQLIRPTAVVILRRHPFGVIDSWRRLRMPDATRIDHLGYSWLEENSKTPRIVFEKRSDIFVRMCLQLGYLYNYLDHILTCHPEWIVVHHEDLCADPKQQFRKLFDRCGLDWDHGIEVAIATHNREGRGFKPLRLASKEIGKWRDRFTPEEFEIGKEILGAFEIEN